jgi:hypothetical protein
LMTAIVSILLKSRVSLTCFRACFLPGLAKDLSAPRYAYGWLGLVQRPKHVASYTNICCLKSIVLLTISVHLFTCSSERDASPSVRWFVTQTSRGRMEQWFIYQEKERVWKETVERQSRVCPYICVRGQRKVTKPCHVSQCAG